MGGQPRRLTPSELACMFDTTSLFWEHWLNHSTHVGRWREMVSRSAVTLKLMTYAPGPAGCPGVSMSLATPTSSPSGSASIAWVGRPGISVTGTTILPHVIWQPEGSY